MIDLLKQFPIHKGYYLRKSVAKIIKATLIEGSCIELLSRGKRSRSIVGGATIYCVGIFSDKWADPRAE